MTYTDVLDPKPQVSSGPSHADYYRGFGVISTTHSRGFAVEGTEASSPPPALPGWRPISELHQNLGESCTLPFEAAFESINFGTTEQRIGTTSMIGLSGTPIACVAALNGVAQELSEILQSAGFDIAITWHNSMDAAGPLVEGGNFIVAMRRRVDATTPPMLPEV